MDAWITGDIGGSYDILELHRNYLCGYVGVPNTSVEATEYLGLHRQKLWTSRIA